MRKFYTVFLAILLTISAVAQSPQKMSYQAIIRDANNALVTNHIIGMRISIMQGSVAGIPVYVETQTPTTNANGLISIEIGSVTPNIGVFASINWSGGLYFIKTEIDPIGGVNYTIIGTNQLLSVPYAFYASTCSNTSFPNDISVNGHTVGRGNGAVPTNATFGNQALHSNTSGSYNTAIGAQVLFLNTTGSGNTAIGYNALYFNTAGYNNTANGYAALYSNTTGYENSANGRDALGFNTTGYENSATGFQALLNNTTGNYNTANGYRALYSNITGNNNTANGYRALYLNTTGYENTANGINALYANTTGSDNTANGIYALNANTTGSSNTANGIEALFFNTTGCSNTAFGSASLLYNTTGWENVAVGEQAVLSNTDGFGNIGVGFHALENNTIGNDNIAIGYGADVSSGNLENATVIGLQARVDASNKVRIGNTDITVIEGQVGFTSASDFRLKKNIKDLTTGLDFITKLRPVEYQMKKGNDKINYGFIAQDIEKLVGTNNSLLTIGNDTDRTLGLRYTDFIAPIVKAIQEQEIIIKEQQKEIDELKKLVETLIK